MYRTSHSFGALEQKFPSLIFYLIAGLVPRTSSSLAAGCLGMDQVFLVLSWLVLNLYFPDPATCPIVYSFNSVQIVNKMLYTMKMMTSVHNSVHNRSPVFKRIVVV